MDTDGDGIGDTADSDDDGDGAADGQDCEPLNPDVYPGAEELCNNVDDNCDDVVDQQPCDDEDPCTLEDVCVEGTCSGTPLQFESNVCDGLDEDCDGITDEDCSLKLRGGLMTDGGQPISGNGALKLRSNLGAPVLWAPVKMINSG